MSQRRPQVDALVEQQLGRALLAARAEFQKITADPRFLDDCMTRYRIGQAEYGHRYEWLAWPDSLSEGEQYTEALDYVVYKAMRDVRNLIHGDGL